MPVTVKHRIALVNEHRVMLDRQVILGGMSPADLEMHELLIELHVPYGEDPWCTDHRYAVIETQNDGYVHVWGPGGIRAAMVWLDKILKIGGRKSVVIAQMENMGNA